MCAFDHLLITLYIYNIFFNQICGDHPYKDDFQQTSSILLQVDNFF